MRLPEAIWKPVPSFSTTDVVRPARGLVLHVIVGSIGSAFNTFSNVANGASSHFAVDFDGTLYQFVDTANRAWAEANGNPEWYSVETAGTPDQPLTAPQVDTIAHLFARLSLLDGFPLQVTDDINGRGLIIHSDGGSAWGGHACPGPLRAAQRPQIVALARQMTQEVTPMYAPALALQPIVADLACPTGGAWLLGADGSVYAFGGAPFKGGANGHDYFADRTPARLELPRPDDAAGSTYIVVATSRERYAY